MRVAVGQPGLGALSLAGVIAPWHVYVAVLLNTAASTLVRVVSRGGPAIGDANVGWVAALVGPATALSLGGLLPVVTAAGFVVWAGRVRDHQLAPT